jgi:hypothetical protein
MMKKPNLPVRFSRLAFALIFGLDLHFADANVDMSRVRFFLFLA